MRGLYTVIILIYGLCIHLASLLSPKAKSWVNGRKNWADDLRRDVCKDTPYIWIHCASAGEFEQAIPIIDAIRQKKQHLKVVVSFYSPSGFELYKDSALADIFFYLPLDTYSNASTLLQTLHPEAVIFIQNERWWNIIYKLKEQRIPTFLINASQQQIFSPLYNFYLRQVNPLFTKIFDTTTYGNTKLERVIENSSMAFSDDILQHFCSDSFVLILGSSWDTEISYTSKFFNKFSGHYPNFKIIIAPHEFDIDTHNTIPPLFTGAYNATIPYSNYNWLIKSRILFLDKRGILKYAYRYADIAFIGGGFEQTVHNVSEAVVYGIPAIFGPKYTKFEEVTAFIQSGFAFPAANYCDFEDTMLSFIEAPDQKAKIAEMVLHFFAKEHNTSDRIINEIL